VTRTSSLVTALSILLFTAGILPAQHPIRHSTTHTLAHKAVVCADSLDVCPPEGCGGGDPSLNVKKNVLQKPEGQPQEFTFEDFIHLESERPGPGEYIPGDRKAIEEMGEDTFVALNGFMIGAHPGSPETCNCKLSGEPNNDFHINLVERKTDRLTDSVVVEMTPKMRKMNPSWTLTNLQNLLDETNPPYVRVSGLLLLDTEHISQSGGPRITIWEIHPVTRFQVCKTTVAACDSGSGWRDLD
jgi:hypothetical protein